MISIQVGAGTFCTPQPVPAAVENSWKAEDPDRAAEVTTTASTAASLLCMKIWTVSLPWGFRWCIVQICTAACKTVKGSKTYFLSCVFPSKQSKRTQCLSTQLPKLNQLLKLEEHKICLGEKSSQLPTEPQTR